MLKNHHPLAKLYYKALGRELPLVFFVRYKMASSEKGKNLLRSFYNSVSEHLQPKKATLPSFEEVLAITQAKERTYLGVHEIEVDKIIGSEGRFLDFNPDFQPLNLNIKRHMLEIEKLFDAGYHFPPISVFKVDEFYFVRDGNHRVAVAKERNQIFIDAEVTEVKSPVPITKELRKQDKEVIKAHADFLLKTGLDQFGRDANINLQKAEGYAKLTKIIESYGQTLSNDPAQPLDFKELAQKWYSSVFLPFAEDAYRFDLLARFPKKTTGDLYVWVQTNWHKLKSNQKAENLPYIPNHVSLGSAPKGEEASSDDARLFRRVISKNLKLEDNFLLTHHIGIAVANLLLVLEENSEPKIVIVRRRYHPSERKWSLPIAMLRPKEEFKDASTRALRNVLGYKKTLPTVHFCTNDQVDRYPFGRCLGVGMLGFLPFDRYSEKLIPGHISDQAMLCPLSSLPSLAFDHFSIIKQGLQFVLDHSHNLEFLSQHLEEDTPLQLLTQQVKQIQYFLKSTAPKMSV